MIFEIKEVVLDICGKKSKNFRIAGTSLENSSAKLLVT